MLHVVTEQMIRHARFCRQQNILGQVRRDLGRMFHGRQVQRPAVLRHKPCVAEAGINDIILYNIGDALRLPLSR